MSTKEQLSGRLTGVVEFLGDVESPTDRLTKQTIALKVVNGEYEEFVQLEAVNSKVSELEGLKEGDLVTIGYNLRGRKYTDKKGATRYFNSLSLWSVKKEGEVVTNSTSGDLPF